MINIKHTPRDDIDERMPTFAVRVVQLSVARTERPSSASWVVVVEEQNTEFKMSTSHTNHEQQGPTTPSVNTVVGTFC